MTDANGKVLGVGSDRDILRAVARVTDWQSCHVGDVMTPDPITVNAETSFCVAVSKLLLNKFNSLPVVGEGGTVTGILTSTDVLWSQQRAAESMHVMSQQSESLDAEKNCHRDSHD